jgi:ABC-type amino acid transport substrate-binding protein
MMRFAAGTGSALQQEGTLTMDNSRRSFLALAAFAGLAAAALPLTSADAGILDELKGGQRTLIVGTDATFPPFEETSTSGEKSGFDIDLVNAIAAKIGIKKIEFQQVPFRELVPSLQAKHIDLAASAIYITDERKKVVDFSEPYFSGGLSVMLKPDDNSVAKAADLDGKRLSVQVGTKSVDYLKQTYPKAELVVNQTNDQMFQALQSGRADAVVTGYPAARYYIKVHGGAKLADFLLTNENYGYAVRKDDPDLLKAIDGALDALKKDGTIKSIQEKWFGSAS